MALLGLEVVLLLLPRPPLLMVLAPMQTVLLAPLRGGSSLRQDLVARRSEVGRLAEVSARLAVENARLTTRIRLSSGGPHQLLTLPESGELVRASVIARDIATLQRYVVVGRGRRHGIGPGTPALVPEGLVGKVVAAGDHQALVQTILDPESRTAAICPRSAVIGIARADRTSRVMLDFVERDADVRVGDTVLTSGLGGVFPRGLPIGLVTVTEGRPAEMFTHIELRPLAPISRLEYLFLFRAPDYDPEADPWLDNLQPSEVDLPEENR